MKCVTGEPKPCHGNGCGGGDVKANEYDLMVRAVEEGVAYGLNRAFKHRSDSLTDDQRLAISTAVEEAVMNTICEWFTFDHVVEE
jgi:hypothetical protein